MPGGMFPDLTHVTHVKIDGIRHLVDLRPDDQEYARTLCGLPSSRELVKNRSGAGKLPLCPACDAADAAREPHRGSRMLR
jgi:hypothetical protein